MSQTQLKANKRTLTGRKVKQLRRQGILPGNLFGKKTDSVSIKLSLNDFSKTYSQVGETGLINLIIDHEKPRPVLITNVQLDPVTSHPLHADFHQVDLTEKVTADIPVEIIGESLAVKEQGGVLVTLLTEIEVEALPADLPDKFELDINALKNIGDTLTIADLKVDKKVTIQLDPEETIVLIQEQQQEEPSPTTEETEVTETKEGEEKKKAEAQDEQKASDQEAKPEGDSKPGTDKPEKSEGDDKKQDK